ncbi:hypothetical protein HMPREF9466_00435 [Fusobacterium necrophorum subsp. funduliforme 1_1_36S]|nr:hypothetical protein HMPREF9466_00435 [Fusobacterium necrophorum subsp. funduliforme 1_1_36S]
MFQLKKALKILLFYRYSIAQVFLQKKSEYYLQNWIPEY